ncbi:MAG: hypothetical protein FJ134_01745 [Deltaproteobacteria bacterium]|nr:hypothetical protein [Deltaproteobacteria bacterium]
MKNYPLNLGLGIFLIIIFITQNIYADSRTPVFIEAQADDSVGNQLIYHIRQGISKSKTLRLTNKEDEPRIELNIVTLDPKPIGPRGEPVSNLQTVYSCVRIADILTRKSMIGHGVGICGRSNVKNVADDIVALADKAIKSFERIKGLDDKMGKLKAEQDHKLWEENFELGIKVKALERALEEEKAKTWWEKLWEKKQ